MIFEGSLKFNMSRRIYSFCLFVFCKLLHTEFQYCEQFKLKKKEKNPHMISDLCLAHDRELSLV